MVLQPRLGERGITQLFEPSHCGSSSRFGFSIQLVENLPDGVSFPEGGASVPLSAGLHGLLDQAKHSVEVVSPVWELQAEPNAGAQV